MYEKLHGTTNVPYSFHIPSDDIEWPEELWARRLGSQLHNARTNYHFGKFDDEKIMILEDAGIIWKIYGKVL